MKKNEVLDYVPKTSIDLVENLINEDNLIIKVVNVRKTKHGDFRRLKGGSNQITINLISNPYRFLITLIHELAHFKVSQNSKIMIRPHGNEWKHTFKLMMLPFLNNLIFPDNILSKLAKYLKNPSATTDSNVDLVISLSRYDVKKDSNIFLFDILNDELFQHNENRIFKKIGKLRKRYICEEIETRKKYLFSPVSRVKKINYEKSCS